MVLGSPPLLVPNEDEDIRWSPQPTRIDAGFDQSRVDPDAQKVVRRLTRHGFQAYLVGGGVRDLLLDRRPKDFDIATDARPEDVRRLFRNSRIIGRRFRLVHVLFGGGKVIEVATFRRSPIIDADALDASPGDVDLLIRSDNAFGEAHEDALRRDFTINALFYDLDAGQILDWVGGMADIERRVVRTIGEPETRFREDPVRILRAIKFAARLDLGIDPDVYDAMVFTRASLARAARPRLFEEILRLLRGGGAHRSIWLAWELGILSVLLPELATFLDDDEGDGPASRVWRLLAEVDRRTIERGVPFDDIVLSTLLLLEPMREACEGERDRIAAAYAFLDPVIARLAMSRRVADSVRRIVSILPRLGAGRAARFARSGLADLAMQIYEIERASRGD
jgi:poly(A) polymerase